MKMRITIYLMLLAVSSFAQTTLMFIDSIKIVDISLFDARGRFEQRLFRR